MATWFNPPVTVMLPSGKHFEVTRVERAAEILLYEWPEEAMDTPAHAKAVRVCLSCLEGKCQPREFRAAFEAAAREAGNLMGMG